MNGTEGCIHHPIRHSISGINQRGGPTVKNILTALVIIALGTGVAGAQNTQVVISTNMGQIHLELFDGRAPQTVQNFLRYVDSGFYNGTIFHRVIPNFMIQGGGLVPGMREKQTAAPVRNEA
ncbi:MAG: peptidylprolyl isomerase, partial [Spirochaetes bacterium]|nr:peptidylprolyl isomerase [Spirochaetota bacterium]